MLVSLNDFHMDGWSCIMSSWMTRDVLSNHLYCTSGGLVYCPRLQSNWYLLPWRWKLFIEFRHFHDWLLVPKKVSRHSKDHVNQSSHKRPSMLPSTHTHTRTPPQSSDLSTVKHHQPVTIQQPSSVNSVSLHILLFLFCRSPKPACSHNEIKLSLHSMLFLLNIAPWIDQLFVFGWCCLVCSGQKGCVSTLPRFVLGTVRSGNVQTTVRAFVSAPMECVSPVRAYAWLGWSWSESCTGIWAS